MENRQGEGKNSVGNVEAKKLISMTHGHELWGGEYGREGGGQDGVEWEGKWDNCNSIINKYIKKIKKNDGQNIFTTWKLRNINLILD